ncbi:MAG: 50S ribosomal protein L6 [Magnetococcus sp. WYHC-3]
MSRIGKKPIPVPAGVEVVVAGKQVTVKGKKGTLTRELHPKVSLSVAGGEVRVEPADSDRSTGALWGMTRAMVSNMVKGVSDGFSKTLEIQGVGYRANVKGTVLELALGYSHPVEYAIPKGITVAVDKNTIVSVSGCDKEQIGQMCAEIRAFRPPEPYKGKGVRYQGEHVALKEGKKK